MPDPGERQGRISGLLSPTPGTRAHSRRQSDVLDGRRADDLHVPRLEPHGLRKSLRRHALACRERRESARLPTSRFVDGRGRVPMIQLRRILCPIDLSPISGHALDHAAALAHRYAAQLTLLHVRDLPLPALLPPAASGTARTGLATLGAQVERGGVDSASRADAAGPRLGCVRRPRRGRRRSGRVHRRTRPRVRSRRDGDTRARGAETPDARVGRVPRAARRRSAAADGAAAVPQTAGRVLLADRLRRRFLRGLALRARVRAVARPGDARVPDAAARRGGRGRRRSRCAASVRRA